MVLMTKEGSTKIVNFLTLGARDVVLRREHVSHILNENALFLKILLPYSRARIRQTKHQVKMTKEGSTKIVNIMVPGAGVVVLGCGHIGDIVKVLIFIKTLNLLPDICQTNWV